RAERVDPEHAVDTVDAPVLFQPAALGRYRHDRAGSVEEVGQHEREHREDRDKETELEYLEETEAAVHRREHGYDRREVRRREERFRHYGDAGKSPVCRAGGRRVHGDADDRGADDPEDQRAFDVPRVEERGQQEAADRDDGGPAVQIPKCHRVRGITCAYRKATVEKADREDKRPDAGADAELDRDRYSIEERSPNAERHRDADRKALERDDAHRSLPGETGALDQTKRDNRIDAEPRRSRVGVVR